MEDLREKVKACYDEIDDWFSGDIDQYLSFKNAGSKKRGWLEHHLNCGDCPLGMNHCEVIEWGLKR